MKKSPALSVTGIVILYLIVVILLTLLTMHFLHDRSEHFPLRGEVSASASSTASLPEPTYSLPELLKKYFGRESSDTPAITNPDPTNDCNDTPFPYPAQCITGQEHCCHGQWICPNVLGQYICNP